MYLFGRIVWSFIFVEWIWGGKKTSEGHTRPKLYESMRYSVSNGINMLKFQHERDLKGWKHQTSQDMPGVLQDFGTAENDQQLCVLGSVDLRYNSDLCRSFVHVPVSIVQPQTPPQFLCPVSIPSGPHHVTLVIERSSPPRIDSHLLKSGEFSCNTSRQVHITYFDYKTTSSRWRMHKNDV